MSSTKSKNYPGLTASDLPQRLAAALNEGRRGGAARSRMSPELSYGRHAGPAPPTVRAAAVMLLLFRREGRWHLPLTQRPASLSRHGGQISLPGGSIEAGETSQQAAERELNEELGIVGPLEILGRLPDCYVFASDFLVTPWVAATEIEPQWQPHDREVQNVVEVSLQVLVDERATGRMKIERGPLEFHAPCIRVGSACVWGATSVILSELGDVLHNIVSF